LKIIKKTNIKLEDAHGGAGLRKLFVKDGEVANIQGITHGYLLSGGVFEMHAHDDCTEFMYVLKGSGIVGGDDGETDFTVGDFFIFPKCVPHTQKNTGKETFEAVYIRVKHWDLKK
jgi:mannose-6-phosphate isomerase-like protein (cupin superfamily)